MTLKTPDKEDIFLYINLRGLAIQKFLKIMLPQEFEDPKDKFSIKKERSRAAFERLQLAWVRTSITILAFGVGVYEFFHNRVEFETTPLFEAFSGRELALVLYSTSFLILLLSLLQHLKSMKRLKESFPDCRYSVASLLSFLLLILALLLAILVLYKA